MLIELTEGRWVNPDHITSISRYGMGVVRVGLLNGLPLDITGTTVDEVIEIIKEKTIRTPQPILPAGPPGRRTQRGYER